MANEEFTKRRRRVRWIWGIAVTVLLLAVGWGLLPRAVQVVAPLYRDDLAFRGARALERAATLPLANPAETAPQRG